MPTVIEPPTSAATPGRPAPAISSPAGPSTAAAIPTSVPYPTPLGREVPSPWTLKGDAYWFFPSPTLLPWSPPELPEGAYQATAATSAERHGRFVGGLANIQLVRYTESPVGPYDELLYVPGSFEMPAGLGDGDGDDGGGRRSNKAALRITRIYVSTLASTVNGRRNWNIPKRLARFAFDPVDPAKLSGPTRVSVFACLSNAASGSPAFAPEPFFSVILTPSILPSFPLKSQYLPLDLRLVMPPLDDETAAGHELVGTERWASLTPSLVGPCRAVWGKGALTGPGNRWTDGVGFPDTKPYSLGLVWENVRPLSCRPDKGVGERG
jgi:hypothetical protein